jgi:hypothetical protein
MTPRAAAQSVDNPVLSQGAKAAPRAYWNQSCYHFLAHLALFFKKCSIHLNMGPRLVPRFTSFHISMSGFFLRIGSPESTFPRRFGFGSRDWRNRVARDDVYSTCFNYFFSFLELKWTIKFLLARIGTGAWIAPCKPHPFVAECSRNDCVIALQSFGNSVRYGIRQYLTMTGGRQVASLEIHTLPIFTYFWVMFSSCL